MHDAASSDDALSALSAAIGDRIKQLRLARGWTLDRLAEAAGVSRRMLINVEHGAVNPSVGTLLRISDALGVGLPALVDAPQPKPVRITRAGRGAVLWSSPSGGRGALVAATEPPGVVELWDWTLAPGDVHRSESHRHGTRELLQVLQGTLIVEIGHETITLEGGDAVSFPSDLPHAYRNPTEGTVHFTLVVHEPSVGEPAPHTNGLRG